VSGSSVGSSDDGPWEVEQIPPSHHLLMRIHENDVEVDGRPMLRAFRNRDNPLEVDTPKAMSTDWCKYSTPEKTRARALSSAVAENGVVSLLVSGVLALYKQQVAHSPWYRSSELPAFPNNRAHTDVIGPKSKKETTDPDERIEILGVRSGFVELSFWEIRPRDP
jgi:hypothetical protein